MIASQIPSTASAESLMSACVEFGGRAAKRRFAARPDVARKLLKAAAEAVDDVVYDGDQFMASNGQAYLDAKVQTKLSDLRNVYARERSRIMAASRTAHGASEVDDAEQIIYTAILALLMALIPHLKLGPIGKWLVGRAVEKIAKHIAEWLAALLSDLSPDAEHGVSVVAAYGAAA